jgi:hypothetical protein
MKKFFTEARAQITLDCLLIAVWIFLGVFAWYSRNYFVLGMSASGIAQNWKLLWRDYDEFTNDDLTKRD